MANHAQALASGTPRRGMAPMSFIARIPGRRPRCVLQRGGALASVLLVLLAFAPAREAHAVVRRCIGPDGGTIYTDRPCDQFNAREQVATQPDPGNTAAGSIDDTGPVRSDCSRTPDALLFDLRRAVESANINALAGLYHWPGTGGRAAVHIMDRLEGLTVEAGASVDLVYPESAFVIDNPAAYPDMPAENPTGIRITRYVDAASGQVPEQTLGLRRHAGCWWIHF